MQGQYIAVDGAVGAADSPMQQPAAASLPTTASTSWKLTCKRAGAGGGRRMQHTVAETAYGAH